MAGVRCAFDILFKLLDRFDDADDRMVFFADEGGSWMVGIDWKQVLPAWFRVLSLAEARKVATPSQRKELAER
jgi:hypothetical protein